MIRTEIGENGTIVYQEPFTDFNEFEEMLYILRQNGMQPNPILHGRGGYYVVEIDYENKSYLLHLYLKKVTFGGRDHRPDEKRTQFSAALDRRGYEARKAANNISLIVGIYKSGPSVPPVCCTWRIDDWGLNIGRAFNCFTTVECILESYINIIAQHKTAVGQISCAFRPQYFATYLGYREILHIKLVEDQDLIDNDSEILSPVDLEPEDIIPKMEDLFEPVMDVLRAHNGISSVANMEIEVADNLELSEQARQLIHNTEEGFRSELGYRLAWARYYLRLAGLITSPKRKIWQLTELGGRTPGVDKGQIKRLRRAEEVAIAINEEAFNDLDSENGIEQDFGGEEVSILTPFDPNLVDIRTRNMSLDLILKRLSRQTINMDTRFQRRAGLWNLAQQSRLIESILVKIPLPVFYFDGSDDDNWLVVDGLQRLTALDSFVNKEAFALTSMEFLDKFNGKTFSQLPPYLQRRIEEFETTSYVIAPGTPSNLKFNVFKRINTGGLILNNQEIRNALNQGIPAEFVNRLAEMRSFKIATDFSIPEERMLDREFVTRFLAFYLFSLDKYNSDLEDYLNRAMEAIGALTPPEREQIVIDFDRGMTTAHVIFGKHAFRKNAGLQSGQKPINKALFEVWSVLLSKLSDSETQTLIDKRELLKGFAIVLENDDEFRKSISSSTNDRSRVRIRFESVNTLIKDTLEL